MKLPSGYRAEKINKKKKLKNHKSQNMKLDKGSKILSLPYLWKLGSNS